MDKKKELLIKLTELSEQIRHSKRDHSKHNHKEKHVKQLSDECSKTHRGGKGRGKNKLSFTAKRTICILLQEESINQRSISKMLGVSAQTVSEMIKNLESKELILKTQGEINNENIISLSEKGKVAALEASKRMDERATMLFENISDEELDTLYNILDKISQNNLGD